VSAAAGMAVHESQSLLWERMVALGLPFCTFLLPKLRAAFPAFGEGKTADELYAAVNAVRAESLIRVEADEVT
jgi:carboxypeptidase Taq